MSRWSGRRERFRAHLAGGVCLHPAAIFDPVSARIAEDLGFETGMLAGSVASLSEIGAPDLFVLTLSELAHQVLRISRAAELPLMVDADHGYGNAHSVMRTVEELEIAGAAGLSIEDTALPQAFATRDPALISLEEGVGKMRAALAARRDPGLVIAGRTSAAQFAGVEEAIRRVRAYAATNVDAIFLVGVRSRADLDAIAACVDLPLIVGAPAAEVRDRDYLGSRGVRLCLQGHQPFLAAVRAISETLRALRDGQAPEALQNLAGADLMQQLSRAGDYERARAAYLEPGDEG